MPAGCGRPEVQPDWSWRDGPPGARAFLGCAPSLAPTIRALLGLSLDPTMVGSASGRPVQIRRREPPGRSGDHAHGGRASGYGAALQA
jgi:hypothetical protein